MNDNDVSAMRQNESLRFMPCRGVTTVPGVDGPVREVAERLCKRLRPGPIKPHPNRNFSADLYSFGNRWTSSQPCRTCLPRGAYGDR
jgi:hypothetical protein